MQVLVKPNWVRHASPQWGDAQTLTTHSSLIRPVVEAACAALRLPNGEYEGTVVLADAPLQSACFSTLLHQAGIFPLLEFWRKLGLPVVLADLRALQSTVDESTGIILRSSVAPGDPLGYRVVDIGTASRLEPLMRAGTSFGVSGYDNAVTNLHHQPGAHRYKIANSLLKADVVINLPKWKTHVKTGITGALKNFIGINCDKDYLPHFRLGAPAQGGDEYPNSLASGLANRWRPTVERLLPNSLLKPLREALQRSNTAAPGMVFGGAWPGNDTLWRTVHDMVFIARWLGPDGAKRSSPRPILTLLDAIVAGEGDGPLRPSARAMHTLVFGTDPGQVDVYAASLSGFSWHKIPLLRHLADPEATAITRFPELHSLPSPTMDLAPPAAWRQLLSSAPLEISDPRQFCVEVA